MPKQVLVFKDGIASDHGGANLPRTHVDSPRVEVGWSKAGSDNPTGAVSIRLAANITQPDADDQAAARQATAGIRSVIGGRDDINRLIRTLRKARDQAFGTDA